MKIGIKFENMPRGFKSWFATLKGKVRRLTFPDADAVGFEVDNLENEVYQEMLKKFPHIIHTVKDDEKGIIYDAIGNSAIMNKK